MADLTFDCVSVVPERYGAGPALLFRLRVSELSWQRIHSIALRCQIRIEPSRRRYTDSEAELLTDVFGERARWGETLKPMQFANVAVMVPGFEGEIDVEMPVPVSYDMEVATGKYLHALDGEPVVLTLLFSGTVFGKSANGFWIEQVPWHSEATYHLPSGVWRDLMDAYFPDEGWLRLHRDTIDDLLRYKALHGLATWEDTVARLLAAGSVVDAVAGGSAGSGAAASGAGLDGEAGDVFSRTGDRNGARRAARISARNAGRNASQPPQPATPAAAQPGKPGSDPNPDPETQR